MRLQEILIHKELKLIEMFYAFFYIPLKQSVNRLEARVNSQMYP